MYKLYVIWCNRVGSGKVNAVLFVNHRESVLCQVEIVPMIACVHRAT